MRLTSATARLKPERNVDVDDEAQIGDKTRRPRIRCPKCGWQPGKDDRWWCICEHVWNTFETRGVCPKCGERYEATQCLNCHEWSPHEDWYEKDEDP